MEEQHVSKEIFDKLLSVAEDLSEEDNDIDIDVLMLGTSEDIALGRMANSTNSTVDTRGDMLTKTTENFKL